MIGHRDVGYSMAIIFSMHLAVTNVNHIGQKYFGLYAPEFFGIDLILTAFRAVGMALRFALLRIIKAAEEHVIVFLIP